MDDIIATGGSIVTAAEMVLGQGAKAVHAAAVHGVLSGNARQRMSTAGVGKLFLTDTLESAGGGVSVATMVADILKS
jgi:ribose-phosphate pyrophosphokinase